METSELITKNAKVDQHSGLSKPGIFFQPKLTINAPHDAYEQEADAVADRVMQMPDPVASNREGGFFNPAGACLQRKCVSCDDDGKTIQRKVMVDPPAQTGYIAGLLNKLCAGANVTTKGNEILSNCNKSSSNSCDAVCDVTSDPKRTYKIQVQPQSSKTESKTLWDGSKVMVPIASPTPYTTGNTNPTIMMNTPGSITQKYESFDSSGKPQLAEDWRILAHELFGHGRLKQTYTGGPGNRPGHDSTIDTENTIAGEHGSSVKRGHFADAKPPGRQGESFFEGAGSKLVFFQTDGIHYEVV